MTTKPPSPRKRATAPTDDTPHAPAHDGTITHNSVTIHTHNQPLIATIIISGQPVQDILDDIYHALHGWYKPNR